MINLNWKAHATNCPCGWRGATWNTCNHRAACEGWKEYCKMRLLYKFEAEGVHFSKNGTAAYKRGEKPIFLWTKGERLEETVPHHIAQPTSGRGFSRELAMFYRIPLDD